MIDGHLTQRPDASEQFLQSNDGSMIVILNTIVSPVRGVGVVAVVVGVGVGVGVVVADTSILGNLTAREEGQGCDLPYTKFSLAHYMVTSILILKTLP